MAKPVHTWTQRHLRRTIWLSVACVAVPFMFLFVVLIWYRDAPIKDALPFTGFFGIIALTQLFWMIPVRKRVLAHKGRLCGTCLFPFEGLPDQGTCPECGDAYDADETIRGWEHDLRVTLAEADPDQPAKKRLD